MSRLDDAFKNKPIFMPYFPLGYPALDVSIDVIEALALRCHRRGSGAAFGPALTAFHQFLGRLMLDFAGVEYISSMGFQVLLRAQRLIKTQGGSFALASLQGAAKSVFETANFGRVIRCHETVKAALTEMSYSAFTVYQQQHA